MNDINKVDILTVDYTLIKIQEEEIFEKREPNKEQH